MATGGPFTLATQVYIVTHKAEQTSSQHQVHVSSHLVYCLCGFFTAYLLPCRHVLAANGTAFADVFQAGQYHPRWRLHYSEATQRELLSKQFWLSVGQVVTSEGLKRVQYKVARAQGEQEEGDQGRTGALPASASHAQAAAAAGGVDGLLQLPAPMYPSASLELQPALLSPQQLFHMIEGECAGLRQLACANPAKLSGLVWTELHQAKLRITQHIDREQRMQQQLHVSAAATVSSDLTSEGFPLAALLAPVPLTVSKPGRPSSKRSRAAVEGVVARKVRAMLPASQREGRTEHLEQEDSAADVSDGARAPVTASSAEVAAAAAAACQAAVGTVGAAGAGAAAGSSSTVVRSVAASAAAAVGGGRGGAAAAAAARVSDKGRVLVRRAPFE